MTATLKPGYRTMLANLRRSLQELEQRAAATGKRADAERVAAIKEEIRRVEQGEL